jgi:hypothetical protein
MIESLWFSSESQWHCKRWFSNNWTFKNSNYKVFLKINLLRFSNGTIDALCPNCATIKKLEACFHCMQPL